VGEDLDGVPALGVEELAAALGSLADAVTVQDADGRLVYANAAAAELLGCASPEELLATPPTELIQRFESFMEDGSPLDPDRLPGRRVLRGERPEPIVVRAINRATGEERWQLVKASAVPSATGRGMRAINIIEDVTETKRAEIAQRMLAKAGEELAASLDYESTLKRVAQMAVPNFADWCAVSLLHHDGALDPVAVAHVDPDKVRMARELQERYPAHADDPQMAEFLTQAKAELSEITPEMLREAARDDEHFELLADLGLRSAIRVPMTAGDDILGVITFVTTGEGRLLGERDVSVAEELARRASVAIQNAQLFDERSRAARTLEHALRPPLLPAIPGWRTAGLYEPASGGGKVSGDFYDAFEVPGGWAVMIGDVGGRGVEAAALTAMARYTLRTAAAVVADPVVAFKELNTALLERGGAAICTAALVFLGEGGEVTLCSAGHPPAIVVSGGSADEWPGSGPILGAFEDVSWELTSRTLAPGDQLVLYTDGVFELPGADGRFGEERLVSVLAGTGRPEEAVDTTRTALSEFSGGRFPDDMAMVVLQRGEGAGGPRAGRLHGVATG
jgi:PAS domain S-box-containing protein